MQIKVFGPERNQELKQTNGNEKPPRMTLQEYLESTNLRRKINSRSKSKHKNTQAEQQQKFLEPHHPFSQTLQFFKLNQQWKALKTFSSWIYQLKQLCRQYIGPDQQYISVARVIQKIAQFVKTQIQMIKKDNLLLQSYLVMEASYWPAESSNYAEHDGNNHANNNSNIDRLSNYLRAVLNNTQSDYHTSPDRTQLVDQTQQLDKNSKRSNLTNNNNKQKVQNQHVESKVHKTSTQPKIFVGKESELMISSETRVDTKKYNSQTRAKDMNSMKYTKQIIDSHVQQVGLKQTHNYSTTIQNIINSLKQKTNHNSNKIVEVRPFTSNNFDANEEEQVNNENQQSQFRRVENSEETVFVKTSLQNSQETLRLSLVSRFDQNRRSNNPKQNQQLFKDSKLQKQTSILENAHLSRKSTKSELSNNHKEVKPSLRERKHKTQKNVEHSPQQFDLIVLNQKKFPSTNQQQEGQKLDIQKKQNQTNQKVKISQFLESNKHQETNLEISPIAVRQSPNIISIQTPSTLRRRNPITNETISTKKDEEMSIKINDCRGNQRIARSTVYKSSQIQYDKRNSSRQNIMKRYEGFGDRS